MEQLDLNQSGSTFRMYDNNADGVLDKAELGKYLISLLPKDLAVSI